MSFCVNREDTCYLLKNPNELNTIRQVILVWIPTLNSVLLLDSKYCLTHITPESTPREKYSRVSDSPVAEYVIRSCKTISQCKDHGPVKQYHNVKITVKLLPVYDEFKFNATVIHFNIIGHNFVLLYHVIFVLIRITVYMRKNTFNKFVFWVIWRLFKWFHMSSGSDMNGTPCAGQLHGSTYVT